jgi:hypothetical protein
MGEYTDNIKMDLKRILMNLTGSSILAPGKEPLLGSYEYSYEPSRVFLDQVSECGPFKAPCSVEFLERDEIR